MELTVTTADGGQRFSGRSTCGDFRRRRRCSMRDVNFIAETLEIRSLNYAGKLLSDILKTDLPRITARISMGGNKHSALPRIREKQLIRRQSRGSAVGAYCRSLLATRAVGDCVHRHFRRFRQNSRNRSPNPRRQRGEGFCQACFAIRKTSAGTSG